MPVVGCVRPTVDDQSIVRCFNFCSIAQWIHLGYGWPSAQNRPSSALLNRRNVCIYQSWSAYVCAHSCARVCASGESFWGCSKCQLGMCPSIVRYTQHTAIRMRTGTGTLYLRISRESTVRSKNSPPDGRQIRSLAVHLKPVTPIGLPKHLARPRL